MQVPTLIRTPSSKALPKALPTDWRVHQILCLFLALSPHRLTLVQPPVWIKGTGLHLT